MRRLAFLLAWALPAAAGATSFRLPLGDCDAATQCMDGARKCYVTAYFDHAGQDWNCGDWGYDGHLGSDFGVQGTTGVRPIVAGAAGTVVETNDGCPTGQWGSTCGGGFGNYVKLSHADGKKSIYGHMQSGTLKVAKGQSVTCGQELGRAGSSGNSTGPHLHFEVVDPTYGSDDPFMGTCGGPLTYWVSQGAYCALPATTCEGGSCVPNCAGKVCGTNGCGGTCGTCTGGASCDGNGQCSGTNTSNDATFVSETIPDGTHYKTGEAFTKTWTMKNTGTATWTKAAGFAFSFVRDQQLGAPARVWLADAESIAPGQNKTWTVAMVAPMSAGTYLGYWRTTLNGVPFGDEVWISIVVDPPAGGVDDATFVDETIPDDTHFVANASFTKTWTIKNSGTSTWKAADGYRWEFSRGDKLSATSPVELAAGEAIAPGATKVWSVPMKAPATAGTYRGYWHMTHAGTEFGGEVWVEIIVNPPAANDADGDGHYAKSSGGDDCDDNDPESYPGNAERCDGKDNDCNGVTDGSLTRQCFSPCVGTEHCVAGKWANCDAPAPDNEACNGQDDDCDGFTDDNAYCTPGLLCALGRCVPPPAGADAGAAPVDAGAPPAGADAGPSDGGKFTGGGCGCATAGAPGLALALLALGLFARRRTG